MDSIELPPKNKYRTKKLSLVTTITPPGPPTRVWQTAPHPYKPLLAVTTGKSAALFSLRNGNFIAQLEGEHKRSVRCVAWQELPPSSRAKSQGQETGTSDRDERDETEEDEVLVATGSFDATASIFRSLGATAIPAAKSALRDEDDGDDDDDNDNDGPSWTLASILEAHTSELKSVSFSPLDPQLLATCSRDQSVLVWEQVDEDEFETAAILTRHSGDVKFVKWHPSQRMLASGSYDGSFRVYREEEEVGYGGGETKQWATSAGTDWECVGGKELDVTVWSLAWLDPASQSRSQNLLNKENNADAHDSDEQETRLVTAGDDGRIKIWREPILDHADAYDSGGGRRGGELEWEEVLDEKVEQVHGRAAYAIDIDSEGKRLVSCGGDGRIVVYERLANSDDTFAPSATTSTSVPATASVAAAASETEKMDIDSGAGQAPTATETSAAKNEEELGKTKEKVAEVGSGQTEKIRWVATAILDGAHGVYEVNHVCWAKVPLSSQTEGSNSDSQVAETTTTTITEAVVSAGDDGTVRIWRLS